MGKGSRWLFESTAGHLIWLLYLKGGSILRPKKLLLQKRLAHSCPHRRLKDRSVLQERAVFTAWGCLGSVKYVRVLLLLSSAPSEAANCVVICLLFWLLWQSCPSWPLTLTPHAPASQLQGFQVCSSWHSHPWGVGGHHCKEKAVAPLQEGHSVPKAPWASLWHYVATRAQPCVEEIPHRASFSAVCHPTGDSQAFTNWGEKLHIWL